MSTCKTTIRCDIHLWLSGKTSEHSRVNFIDKPRPCLNYYLFLFIEMFLGNKHCFQFIKHFFVVYIFGFGSGPPHQYLKTRITRHHSTVLDWVATLNTSYAQNAIYSENLVLQSAWWLLSTSHVQNVHSHYQFSHTLFSVNYDNLVLQSGNC